MKNIILFVSLVFPGFYISYDFDASAEGEIEALGYYPVSLENTYDSGALTIGYESLDLKNNIGQEGLIAYGLSYDIIGADYTGADDGDGFLNIYAKYITSINNTLSLWGSLGYNIPQLDLDDYDGGISYGIGIQLNSGIGVGYLINNYSLTEELAELDASNSRIFIMFSFK